jgi:hypothetical protein
MRASTVLGVHDSLERAAREIRINGVGVLPVVDELTVVGMVTESTLATALADGHDLYASIECARVEAPTIKPYETAAEALRLMASGPHSTLVVVDDFGRLMGLVSPSDLYPRKHVAPRPSMVGGMATPFGVYLTTGGVSAGAGNFALMCTGALLFTMLVVASLIGYYATVPLASLGWPVWVMDAMSGFLNLALFLLFMRLIPLAGTHASEHMVVHAIERDEELRPEIVRRMPRVHPRCGTNLAAGAMIFSGLFFAIPDQSVGFIVAALAALYLWRKVGTLLQLNVTTKRPTDKQLANGIAAGRQLLDNYTRSPNVSPGIPQRFLRSGLLQVMAGSALMSGVVYAISFMLARLWHIELPISFS